MDTNTNEAGTEVQNAEVTNARNPVAISFNGAAVTAFTGKHETAHRFRMEVKDGRLFVKPTHRMAGPHVFSDYNKTANGLKIQLDGAQLDKLDINLEPGQKFGLREHKYGWFYLTDEGDDGIQGAKASVSKR